MSINQDLVKRAEEVFDRYRNLNTDDARIEAIRRGVEHIIDCNTLDDETKMDVFSLMDIGIHLTVQEQKKIYFLSGRYKKSYDWDPYNEDDDLPY